MSFNQPVFVQGDPRWGSQQLGDCPGITMATDGCLITSMEMVAWHYEKGGDPSQLNQKARAIGAYYPNPQGRKCYLAADSLHKLYPDIQLVGAYDYRNAAADLSKLVMADDEECIICVDFNHNVTPRGDPDGFQTHWPRVFSYDRVSGRIIIDDPWYGTRGDFTAHYGDPKLNVLWIWKYKIPGWVPPWKRQPPGTPPNPPIITPTPTPAELMAQVAALTTERDALKAEAIADEAKLKLLKDWSGQLDTAVGALDGVVRNRPAVT